MILRGMNKFSSKKKISKETLKNYFQAKWRIFMQNHDFDREEHIKEQAYWRLQMIKEKSPECSTKGICYCGCDILEEVWGDKGCEEKNKCYPDMMSKEDWEKYKTKNNIKIC